VQHRSHIMNTKYFKFDTRNTRLATRNSTYPSDERRATSNGPVLHSNSEGGFVLPMVLVAVVILMALIIGTTMTDYHIRLQAVQTKSQTEAMLAAEAGYERAIFWMSQQTDILTAIQNGSDNGSINFGTSTCSYTVDFHGFMGRKSIFRIVSTGVSGRPSFTRIVDVDVVQETSGWAMGSCTVPDGTSSTSTTGVYFGNGEIVDMPLHINEQNDNPDVADIFISTSNGSPTFLEKVEMGESRKTSGGADKYSSVMSLFQSGITFDQPNVRITDATAVQSKVTRFQNSTAAAYQFTPTTTFSDSHYTSFAKLPAVQLEFYVQGGVGMVKILNNCTVIGYQRSMSNTCDFNVVSGSGGSSFQPYNIYAYHYKRSTDSNTAVPITNTYVTQTFGGYTSDPGGQIYVNGNVVIGSSNYTDMIVKGKITVVATGNIWIADSIKVDDNGGAQRDANGMPSADNPNILGLIAQGVIKVIDPGLSSYATSYSPGHLPNNYPGPPSAVSGYTYQPVANLKSGGSGLYDRILPDPTVIEAALTIGGGGWGAENVRDYAGSSGNYYGDRRVVSTPQDDLYVRGSITEVIRGIVGHLNNDGYIKHYYLDTRLMSGILPGDIWLSGKYIPAPAGWHDHSVNN